MLYITLSQEQNIRAYILQDEGSTIDFSILDPINLFCKDLHYEMKHAFIVVTKINGEAINMYGYKYVCCDTVTCTCVQY